jgi:hypothetical protein
LETVRVDDNLFHLGGHSVRAVRQVARLKDVLDVQLPAAVLFEGPDASDSGVPGAAWRSRTAELRCPWPLPVGHYSLLQPP